MPRRKYSFTCSVAEQMLRNIFVSTVNYIHFMILQQQHNAVHDHTTTIRESLEATHKIY